MQSFSKTIEVYMHKHMQKGGQAQKSIIPIFISNFIGFYGSILRCKIILLDEAAQRVVHHMSMLQVEVEI